MSQDGFMITGVLGGAKGVKKRTYDGKEVNRYSYLVIVGMDSYKITSDYDYSNQLMFGDQVTFSVKPSVYENNLYFRGDLVTDEDK